MNATTSSIVPFSNPEFGELRAAVIEGEPWFVAADVCGALALDQVTNALRRLDDDERTLISIKGHELNAVSEAGLYSLVLSSRKPEARAFKRWVTHEVLPSIRRTGGYLAAAPEEAPEQMMARALLLADETIRRQRSQLDAARPKADLCDAMLLPSKGAWTVSEAARYLANIMPKVRRQDVFDALRDGGMMCKRGTAPTRAGIDTGRMVALAGEYRDPETGEMTVGRQRGKLTAKGIGWLTVALGGGSV